MLPFIDESDDTGLKTEQGASRYFVVALVIFEDHAEAIGCNRRINLLTQELGYPQNLSFILNITPTGYANVSLRRLLHIISSTSVLYLTRIATSFGDQAFRSSLPSINLPVEWSLRMRSLTSQLLS